jgi:hypothetical protein
MVSASAAKTGRTRAEIIQGWGDKPLYVPNIIRKNAAEVAQGALAQPITNPNLDLNRQTRVFNLQEMGNEFTGLKNAREIKEKIVALAKQQNPIKTSELNVLLNIPESMTKATHLVFANSSQHNRPNREIMQKVVSNIQDIFANAPLVEIEKNTDKKGKPNVESFYHFFFPAIVGGKIETVKVDAESFNDNLDIKDVTLYEMLKKNPRLAHRGF